MTEALHKTIRVRCDVVHAFAVFTRKVDLWWPRGHRRYDDSKLVLQTEVGGRFLERAASGEEAVLGEVILCEPPHRIVYTWYPGAITLPTRVEVKFVQEGDETRIDVTHGEGDSGLAERWPERAKLFEKGWSLVLGAFLSCIQDETRE